jgi:hypothetical protein
MGWRQQLWENIRKQPRQGVASVSFGTKRADSGILWIFVA